LPAFFNEILSMSDLPARPAFAEVRAAALDALRQRAPAAKTGAVRSLADAWGAGALALDTHARFAPDVAGVPGRPPRPLLVEPRELAPRPVHTPAGRAALLHALAHIEFNAINLALDAIWRFADMPAGYYADWVGVASEEAMHFTLLADHLQTLGVHYGDLSAHDGLWEMAERTAHDVLARMALVPRTLEARGLDASPTIRAKLAGAGDIAGAAIIDIILRDEVGHVAIGNRWYRWLCARAGRDPFDTYDALARQYRAPRLRAPFNLEARRVAGFDAAELQRLLDGDA
jgi:uncharacterized ferritin-like protein (DUF455 family)